MTNKPIIIDDVDVSGCEWIREVGLDSEYICTCNSPNKTSGYCKDNPNCCYKQLKRKEQECERLKKELHKNFEEKDTLHLIIDRLLEASGYDTNTATAEEFEDVYEHMRYEQQQLEAYKMEAEEGKEINAELKAENEELKEQFKLAEPLYQACNIKDNKINKLKQTLAEIKEIANRIYSEVITENWQSLLAKQILQKNQRGGRWLMIDYI